VVILVGVGLLFMVAPFVLFAVAFGVSDDSSDGETESASVELDDEAGDDASSSSDGGEVTTTTVPAPAAVSECISVSSSGGFLGTGSCAEGGAPYRVLEAFDGVASCADPDNSIAVSGTWSFCVEVNLVENYCYSIPDFGWITPSTCEAPGTVHVVDIVPGATTDSACTQEFQWNRWYAFESPIMVACVMAY
jgi:hypothetical protein